MPVVTLFRRSPWETRIPTAVFLFRRHPLREGTTFGNVIFISRGKSGFDAEGEASIMAGCLFLPLGNIAFARAVLSRRYADRLIRRACGV